MFNRVDVIFIIKKKLVFVSVKMNVNISSFGYWYKSYLIVFFFFSISFFGDIELNVYMEVFGGYFKSIFFCWYKIFYNCCYIDCLEYKFIFWLYVS